MPRRFNFRRDYIFTIVKINGDWRPENVYDLPRTGKIVSQTRVASFEEAHEDLLRCNQTALDFKLDEWAIIQTSKVGIRNRPSG